MRLKWEMSPQNLRLFLFILINLINNSILQSDQALNDIPNLTTSTEASTVSSTTTTTTATTTTPTTTTKSNDEDDTVNKRKNALCKLMPFEILRCQPELNKIDCIYGQPISVNCSVRENLINECSNQVIIRTGTCRFCYQTPEWMHICTPIVGCKRDDSTRWFKANCTVPTDVLCLGSRTFHKNVPCNWTSGYKWSVAMILSLTLGGFGIDRFYLGHFREGLGKLFSFGGLGIWTLVDVVLIYVGYVGPSDGSIYI